MPVTVIHQLFADLHDKICANLIQGFQGVGMHPCADVLLLQIRHGMGKACNDVRHAVLDGRHKVADLHRREGRHRLRPVLLHATERHRMESRL